MISIMISSSSCRLMLFSCMHVHKYYKISKHLPKQRCTCSTTTFAIVDMMIIVMKDRYQIRRISTTAELTRWTRWP